MNLFHPPKFLHRYFYISMQACYKGKLLKESSIFCNFNYHLSSQMFAGLYNYVTFHYSFDLTW